MSERQVVQFELGERRNSGYMPNITELLWMVILLSCPVWWWCNLNKGIRREKGFNFSQAVKLLQTVAVKYSYINLLMFPWLKLGRITFPKRNISSDKIWRQMGKGGRMSDNSWPPGRPVEFPCGPEWVTRRHLSSCIQTSLALANWSLSTPNLFVRNRVSQCICIKSIWS